VTVIPRGIDARRAAVKEDRGRFGLPSGPLFVNVARHGPQKGHVDLVQSFAQVAHELPDAILAVAGRFGATTGLIRETIAELGLDERVHLLDFRSDADVLMASGDVFLFPSFAEGIGTAVLEAVAAGIPVVAYDIPAVREVTAPGELATLVKPGNIDDFARAAIAALELRRDGREILGSRRTYTLENFELGRIATQVETLLRRAAAER
jgi:glycosyltransferase involved in cell wall biosynthesis